MSDKPESGDQQAHKMPEDSVFFDRVAPVLFVVLGVIMVLLILFALGVASGIVPWG